MKAPTLTWSPRDEALLNELTARRAEVMEERRAALADALGDLSSHITDDGEYLFDDLNDLMDFLTRRADAIRDALAPYDSGVRPA